MTKLSNKEKERIIKRDLPGFKLVEQKSRESAEEASEQDYIKAQPDAGTPDFRELRRKYFGDSANESDADARKNASNPRDESDDDEIVKVAPENTSDVLDRGSRAKSVVISRGEVKGSQG